MDATQSRVTKTYVIRNAHLKKKKAVWAPKYSNKYEEKYGEWVCLLNRRDVEQWPDKVILIEFTKAKHLQGLRFCIEREDAQNHDVGSNGAEAANMYEIPMSHLHRWITNEEDNERIRYTLYEIGWWK